MKPAFGKTVSLFTIFLLLILATCSSPYTENSNPQRGSFVIRFGSGIRAVYPPNIPAGTNPNAPGINDLKFEVIFTSATGSGGETLTFTGNQELRGSVIVGTYNVAMNVYLRSDNSIYAHGSAIDNPVTIVTGLNPDIIIQLYEGGGGSFNGPGVVTVFAGDGIAGFRDGPGLAAQFDYPRGIAIDSAGNLYVADNNNNLIRKIDSSGSVSTYAGDGNYGDMDGQRLSAQFAHPYDIAIDTAGNMYVAGSGIRKIDPYGNVTTIATSSQIDGFPTHIAVDGAGNLYITDFSNNQIKKINPSGNVSILAGDGTAGYRDGPGSQAQFNYPEGLVVDNAGNVYVADSYNHRIRKIDPSGNVSTFAGDGNWGNDDGPVSQARFSYPDSLALDNAGNLYVTAFAVRKIDPQGNVITIADYDQFNFPMGIVISSAGSLFVVDTLANQILKISPGSNTPPPSGGGGGIVGSYATYYTDSGFTIKLTLAFKSDFTYTLSTTFMGFTEVEEIGTYSVSGNVITFYPSSGGTDTAIISGNNINWSGIIFTKE